ncbi:MAG TPA: hypothetical protein VF060_18000 [Trebonia sp.]
MSLPARVTTLVIAFVAVVAFGVFVAMHFIGGQPPTEDYSSYASGGQVNVTLMTAPQTTVTNKPDWVTYFIKDPKTGQFVHTTYFAVPANTKVNITVLGYDGCTPLRNPLWGRVTGVTDGVENVAFFNGKTMSASQPLSTFDSWADCSVQHTFAIPSLGINVPIASPTTLNENNNLCGTSPCTGDPADTKAPHTVVTFSFTTPKSGGVYRWQCFVPCGLGYVDGNGGPMATLGYMMGQMEVRA